MSTRDLQFRTERTAAVPRRAVRKKAPATHSAPAGGGQLARGVFQTPYLVNGADVVMAIDSAGNRIAEIALTAGRTLAACADALELLLGYRGSARKKAGADRRTPGVGKSDISAENERGAPYAEIAPYATAVTDA